MTSRQGRIARQLTHWVGGTIIVLMFFFVIADYFLQTHYFRRYQDTLVTRGVSGLKSFLESRPFEEGRDALQTTVESASYVEEQDVSIAVFNLAGTAIVKSPGAISGNPKEMDVLTKLPAAGKIEVRRLTISKVPVVAAVAEFTTKDDEPVRGYAAYIVSIGEQSQIELELWGWRSGIVLLMILGVMLAVRIPVRRFVVAPLDALFMGVYAASKDDFKSLPRCPVDNEMADLFDMFNRLMGHLSDTRMREALGEGPGEGEPGAEAVEEKRVE